MKNNFCICISILLTYLLGAQSYDLRIRADDVPYNITLMDISAPGNSPNPVLRLDSIYSKDTVLTVDYKPPVTSIGGNYFLGQLAFSLSNNRYSSSALIPFEPSDTIAFRKNGNNSHVSGNRHLDLIDSITGIANSYQKKIAAFKNSNNAKEREVRYEFQEFILENYENTFEYRSLLGLYFVTVSSNMLESYSHFHSLKKACDSAKHYYPESFLTKQVCASYQKVIEAEKPANVSLKPFQDLNGEAFEINFRNSEMIVLEFWATWCKPCRESLKSIQQNTAYFKENNIKVFLISLDTNKDQLKRYLNSNQLNGTVLLDPDERNFKKLSDKDLIPYNIILNADGKRVGENIPANLLRPFFEFNMNQ